ncbi:MAG: peptidylprolyl isomerase [Planctomycetes bacterium]|nr:peptidylprolyl isomerase [Planctomycetota bacterium]
MSEGTHSTPSDTFSSRPKTSQTRQRLTLFLAGTAAAVLIAAVGFQIFRAEQAATGEATTGLQSPKAGTAKIGGRSNVYARVNNEYLTYDLLARECVERYGKDMLQNIINRTMIRQACDKSGIEVSEAEVDAEIIRIAKRLNLDVIAWYDFLKVERGVTPNEVRRDRIWPMLALKKLAGEKINVTKQDLDIGFIRHYGPRVEGRWIMLDNIRRAQKVYDKAKKNPENFSRLAEEYSIDRNSAPLGGVIPPIHRYGPHKNLEDVAFRLKDGEISPIVQIGIGQWVILLREGMTKPNIPYEEVRETLYDQILEDKIQESVARVFDKIRQEARVDNYLTNTSTGGIRRVSGPDTSGRVRTAAASNPPGTRTSR